MFSPWLWHKETADSTRQAVKEKLAARFAELDARFAQQSFIAGSHFSAADVYAFVILSWAPMLGLSLKAYPQLQAWMQRIALRPAVQAALAAEGLAKP